MDRDLKDIVAGCKAGSHSSYEALHKRFYRALLGIALRYGRSRDDAEDIVQETFIKVFEKINTYREDGPFESWMKRITHNTAVNHYRGSLRFAEIGDEQMQEGDDTSLEKVAQTMDAKTIIAAMSTLPEGYRILLNLYAIDGYSHPEIATMLGISVGTSKSQLHKARKQLKEILARDFHAYQG